MLRDALSRVVDKTANTARQHKAPIFLLIASLLLVISWFRNGMFIGYAESELTFYRPSKAFLYLWIENIGTGRDLLWQPQAIPTVFVQLILSPWLQPLLRQAILFFFLNAAAALSVYDITRVTQRQRSSAIAGVLAGLFYVLNPFTMIAIWKRFLYGGIFAYVLFPLTIALCERAIVSRKPMQYSVLIGLTTAALSFAFTNLGFLSAYWILIVGWIMLRLLIAKNVERVEVGKFLAFFLPAWTACNLWWVLPILARLNEVSTMLSGPSGASSGFISRADNLLTAIANNAPVGGLTSVLRLVYGPSSGYAPFKLWGPLFDSPFILASSVLVVAVAFTSLLSLNSKSTIRMALLAAYGVFWSLGPNQPTGEAFKFLFLHLDVLQPLRAPFDQTTLIYLVPVSVLFGSSVEYLLRKCVHHERNHRPSARAFTARRIRILPTAFLLGLLFTTYVIQPLPMWTGAVFTDVFGPTLSPFSEWKYARVEVPQYYSDANRWLDTDNRSLRLLQLPLSYTGGAQYDWAYGYMGGDPSDSLFDHPSIAGTAAYGGYVDKILANLAPFMGSSPYLWKPLWILNVKYIVVHRDANFTAMHTNDPTQVTNYLHSVLDPSPLIATPKNDVALHGSWRLVWGENESSVHLNQGTVRLQGVTDSYGLLGWTFVLDKPTDLTNCPLLHLDMNASSTSKMIIQLSDTNGNQFSWFREISEMDDIGRVVIPLWQPDDQFQSKAIPFDYGQVARILVGYVERQPNERLATMMKGMKAQCLSVTGGTPLYFNKWGPVWASNASMTTTWNPFLELDATGISNPAGFGFSYDLAANPNYSNHSYLSFQTLSNETGPLVIQLWDKNGNAFWWDGRYSPSEWPRISKANTWQNITLSLDLPQFVPFAGRISLAHLDHLVVGLASPSSIPVRLSIRSPFFSAGQPIKTEGIDYVKSFGQLDIYDVNEPYFGQRVFAAEKVTFADDYQGMFDLLGGNLDPRQSVIMISSQVNNETLGILQHTLLGSQPQLQFSKISPVEYDVKIEASSAFLLVLSEEFSPYWKAYVDGTAIPDSHHLVANGHANSWIIKKTGAFHVVLKYSLQGMFDVGALATGTFLLVALLISVRSEWRRKWK